ncbi:hypothetical protein H2204_011579 [Knufia peltigerae]|uniref:Uncharacterized protein n=1 Tax=Knufia peltigerae TaxID=1002370 RepID=A0AA39CRR4_9EURO|nr:hypothetical protein H2204_011579 [Knufia peltigerae]
MSFGHDTTTSMAQNPGSTAWQQHHHHHHPHTPHIPSPHVPHIATPHPLAAATQYLDKHVVGVFAKHQTEFNVNRQAREAKREARHSLVDSPIPEYEHDDDVERHESDRQRQHKISTALRTAAVTSFAPALVDGQGIVDDRNEGDDNEAWMAVLAKREAARLRSGTGLSAATGGGGGGDDSGKNSSSPPPPGGRAER